MVIHAGFAFTMFGPGLEIGPEGFRRQRRFAPIQKRF